MKKDAYYFSHDCNARNDQKIVRLRRKFGMEGYGIYFCIIENLREQSDYTLPITAYEDIAYELQVDASKVKSVIEDFDLFIVSSDVFFSARLSASMEKYNALRNKLVESGKKGGLSKAKSESKHPLSEAKATLEPPFSDPQALKERKEKEIKGNESKVNEIKTELEIAFENFRKIYKGDKRGFRTEFDLFTKKHVDWEDVCPQLKEIYERQLAHREFLKSQNKFVPEHANLSTYLNQRRWETEPQELEKKEEPYRSKSQFRDLEW